MSEENFSAKEITENLNDILYGQPVGQFRIIITKAEVFDKVKYGSFAMLPENESGPEAIKAAVIQINKQLDEVIGEKKLAEV